MDINRMTGQDTMEDISRIFQEGFDQAINGDCGAREVLDNAVGDGTNRDLIIDVGMFVNKAYNIQWLDKYWSKLNKLYIEAMCSNVDDLIGRMLTIESECSELGMGAVDIQEMKRLKFRIKSAHSTYDKIRFLGHYNEVIMKSCLIQTVTELIEEE